MKKLIAIIIAFLPLFAVAETLKVHASEKISFNLQKKSSPVVAKAVELANASLKKDVSNSSKLKDQSLNDVEVYQLDKSSNKEMKALGALQVPVIKFITKKDAYWVGIRNGKIIVVGSNGRGAAYGIMQLTELPSTFDSKYESLQIPSVDYRGIILENFGKVDYEQLFQQMIRLRANTLCEGWDEGEAPAHFPKELRTLAEEYGIVLATPHNGSSVRLLEHKSNKSVSISWHDDNYGYMEESDDADDHGGAIYHLSFSGQPHDYLWLCTTQPGLIVNEMKTVFTNGADKLWLVAIHDPHIASYQLDLFLDLAWDINSVKVDNVKGHLYNWVSSKFGKKVADYIIEPLTQYFRLVGIRRPEFMDFSKQSTRSKSNDNGDGGVKNTEFNAEEFGNELERYLNDYNVVCERIGSARGFVEDSRKDEYFTTIEYPVYAAALMATKTLQAQESRLISRPVSFHHDSEALESAVRSIKAYRKLKDLTTQYNAIAEKNNYISQMNAAPNGLAVFGEPVLTDKLSDEEIKKYDHYNAVDASLSDDNTIVRNAYEYSTASSGAKPIDLLGRSLKAIDLYKDDVLTYNFQSGVVGGVLCLAFIPTHAIDNGSLQCSVSIDGSTPRTIVVTDGSHADRWADGVLRGQAIVTLPVSLSSGNHTLTIKALSDHVVLDQWMIDKDVDRQFYIMPIR